MSTTNKELILKIRIVSFQTIYSIVIFYVSHYVVQNKENDFIWLIPSFIISLFITCNYIFISQKIIQTIIFSAISSSSISIFIGYIGYVLGLRPRWDDIPPFISFICFTLIFLLLYSGVSFILHRIIKKKRLQVISTESAIFRKIEKVAILFIMPLIGLIFYCAYINSSPEKILKKQFNISLNNFEYTAEFMERVQHPSGVVDTHIIFKFNHLTQENIDYLQSLQCRQLPLHREKQLQTVFDGVHPQIIEEFYLFDSGYYLYDIHSSCCGLYNKFFIIDTEKKVAVLYYQVM